MEQEIILNQIIEINNKNTFINNINPLIKNKEIFNILFYIFCIFGILSKSKLLIIPSSLLCCCKLVKIYKNNKRNIDNIIEYII